MATTKNFKHSLIFDGTSYYIVSFSEAIELQKKDKDIEIIKSSDNIDLLDNLAEKLNEEI